MSVATEGGQASAIATQRRKGVTPPSDRAGRSTFVSDVIVELGFVDRATVEEAVQDARRSGKAVPRILLSMGALSEDQLARATAERYGLDHVDLSEFEVDVAASNLISRVSANRYGAVPIAFDEDGALVVAMADPADPLATSDIAVMTKLEVKPVVATAEGIESLLGRLHEVDRSEHGQPGKGPPPAGDDAQAPGRVSGAVIWQAEGAPKPDSDLSPDAAPAAQPAVGSAPVSELQTQVRDLEEKLRVEREEHAAACERLKAEVEEMQEKMVVLLEKLERAERLEGEVATAAAGVGDAEQRAEVASSKVAELEGRLAELEEAHREAEEHAKAELEAALSRTQDAERKAEAATERAGKADAGAEKAEARVSEVEDAVSQAEARVARTERAAKDAEARAVEAEAAATAAEERADAAERIGGEAAERLSELEGADERAERSRRALAEMREQAEREQELLARREQELEETLRAERSRVERLTRQLAGVSDLGDSVGAALEQLATVRDSLARAGEAAATAPPPQTEPPAAS